MKSKFLFKIKPMVAIVLGIGLFGTVSAQDYCEPYANNHFDFIEVFETYNGETNIYNESGEDDFGYGDYYDTHSVSVYAGNYFDFKMSFYSYFDDPYGARIWIDWNNDGTFDASEVVFMSSAYKFDYQDGTITVPSGTPAGDYRMRINMSFSYSTGNPNPCESYYDGYGEYEDYKLTVLEEESEPGETCGWRIRVWGNNAMGITWELKDGKDNVADESPEGGWGSKTISHLTDTFDLEGPVTFTLNANTSGDYQSVNYYLLRDGAKIEHGRARDSIVIHERDCSDDGGEAAARPGMNASLSGFDFSYHPNPVKDVLYINSVQDVKEVKVFNIAGQQLINLNKGLSSNSEINVSTLPEGVYVIRAVLEDGQIETFKVVKK